MWTKSECYIQQHCLDEHLQCHKFFDALASLVFSVSVSKTFILFLLILFQIQYFSQNC